MLKISFYHTNENVPVQLKKDPKDFCNKKSWEIRKILLKKIQQKKEVYCS